MGIKGYKIIGIITFSILFIMILTALSISNNLTALTTYLAFGISIFVALLVASAFADT
jgi:glucan phosphoethanolaminetransferase (alkaline phosphatase superfamily)